MKPKPPEPYHKYTLRLPRSLWKRLKAHAAKHRRSVRVQTQMLVETGLGSALPVVKSHKIDAVCDLPWLDREEN